MSEYKKLLYESEKHCYDMLVQEEKTLDWLAYFEAWADLYFKRFGRLYPGKSEPMAMNRNSNDDENRTQREAWHSTGLAKHDAIMEVIRLQEKIERLNSRIDELER